MNSSESTVQSTKQRKFFSYAFLFGLFLLAASLPYSKFLMSVSLFVLIFSWLFEGDLKEKIRRFSKNRIALVVSSLFVLHALGLLYTTDLQYGMEDLKKKIPLALLPLLFASSKPISKQMFDRLMSVFTASVISATIICFFVLLGYGSKQILHPQQASIFMSHIRFGLLISLTVFVLGYFFSESKSRIIKTSFILLMLWLIIFLIMMESATGLVCTLAAFTLLLIRYIFISKNIKIKILLLALLAVGSLAAVTLYYSTASEFTQTTLSDNRPLPALTKAGNPYMHDTLNKEIENGHYVWRNVCEPELTEAWNKKSQMNYAGKDLRGNELKFTLLRFLTSKGLTKDAEGLNGLTQKEIEAIEKGIPNVNFVGVFNPTARLQKIIWEFDLYLKGGNPSGHSVVQRLEFWKAALEIIKEDPLFGVGTGDVKKAFEDQYNNMNSPLAKEWRLRSHNQFLAITVAFGFIGLILFLITLLFPLIADKNFNNYLYLMFFVIGFLSMISEDTLETQAGVTFFAFFNSLLLFLHKDKLQIK